MLHLNSIYDENTSKNSSLINDNYEGFTEYKNYFERSKPNNVEIAIFVDRLIAIFEKLLSQLEFAATLPLFLSHPRVLDVLEKSDLKQVVSAFLPFSYFMTKDSSIETINHSILEEEAISETLSSETVCSSQSQAPRTNSSVRTVLQILHSYKLIRDMAKEYEPEIPKCTVNFLRQLTFFLEYVVSTTKLTPQQERDEELRVKKIQADTEKIKIQISELTIALEEQKIKHQKEASELTGELQTQMNKWNKINEEFNDKVSETLSEAEKRSAESLAEFKKRMEEHETEMNNLKSLIEEEQKTSQKTINAVQGKKFKVESQLTSLILKYDTDSAENQEAFEELMDQFRAIDDERVKLMEEMEEQKTFYDKIISEREEAKMGAFRVKYKWFVTNRAARIIQRWWREILKAKPKRKGKKGGKKSKAKRKA